MKKLLVTGASGFLGWNICQAARFQWQVTGTFFSHGLSIPHCHTVHADLRQYRDCKRLLSEIEPDAVIHAAAAAQPNFCQSYPKKSKAINVQSCKNICILCADRRIPFVFTSSDLVFDGTSPPYTEQSPVSPISIYGEQKVEAETLIQNLYPEGTICRMPLLFGDPSPISQSFLQPLVQSLQKNIPQVLFYDEYRSPTSGKTAAEGLLLAVEKVQGIIHLGGRESISRYDFGLNISNYCGFNSSLIQKMSQKSISHNAPRPSDVSLDSSKAYTIGHCTFSLLQEFGRIEWLKIFRLKQ